MVGGIPYMTRTNKTTTAPKSTRPSIRRAVKVASRQGRQPLSAVVASSSIVKTQRPVISASVQGTDARITVKHREYIADVAGSVSFANTAFSINPGLVLTFPWLASIAKNYESYKFKKLNFEFETQKSTATNGTLMMAVDFDAADASANDKVDLMSMHNAVRSPVWGEAIYVCDRSDLEKFGVQRYVRQASLSSNLDIKTYDVGKFQIATQGCADTTAIGELYVDYEVELMTPQRSNNIPESTLIVGASGTVTTSWFGTTPTLSGGGSWTATGSTLTCVIPGDYLFMLRYGAATSVTVAAPTGTASPSAYYNSTDTTAALMRGIYVANAVAGSTVILNETAVGAWASMTCVIAPYTAP